MTPSPRQGGERRRVVVGYDGSATSRAALEHAAREAGPDGIVYVVYAYGAPPDWLGFPNYERLLDDHRARGRELLEGLTSNGGAALDAEIAPELMEQPAAEAIAKVAQVRDADEIVVGSRGRSAGGAAVLGSVSHELLHIADRPVVVIPTRERAATRR